jgi:hypothetical protein
MKILLNYANGKFLESQFKNSQSGLAAGFNVVYQMGGSDIESCFSIAHHNILSEKRGAGYWLWKPYFINRILKNMNETDILFYSDSGSIFIRRMEPIFDAVTSDPRGIVAFELAGGHIEKQYTKMDLLKYMNMESSEYADSPQRMASFMCFRGTNEAKRIVSEYLELAKNPHFITDTSNQNGWVEPNFKGHRHDQSIWSLLTKKHNVTILRDPTQWGLHHNETTEAEVFIHHTRDSR